MRNSAPTLTLLIVTLALPLSQGAVLYVSPEEGAGVGAPLERAPDGEFIDLRTNVVYRRDHGALTPIGVGLPHAGYVSLTTASHRTGDCQSAPVPLSGCWTRWCGADVCERLYVAVTGCAEVRVLLDFSFYASTDGAWTIPSPCGTGDPLPVPEPHAPDRPGSIGVLFPPSPYEWGELRTGDATTLVDQIFAAEKLCWHAVTHEDGTPAGFSTWETQYPRVPEWVTSTVLIDGVSTGVQTRTRVC